MDEEIRSACIKRQQANELTPDTDRLMHLEGLEEEDEETREAFACPFCSRDFDVVTLCHHIQDEHCFQTNNKLVCPICAARIGKDMLKHLTLQHGCLFKARRRKSRNRGISSNSTLPVLGKEPQEGRHPSFHRKASIPAAFHSSSATLDPLLLSFLYSMTICEAKKQEPSVSSEESLAKDSSSNLITDVQVINSAESSLTIQDREQKFEEVSGRVSFVQHLVLSTILGDLF